MEDEQFRKEVLIELRHITNAVNAGMATLIVLALRQAGSSDPSSAEWQRVRNLYRAVEQEMGLENRK